MTTQGAQLAARLRDGDLAAAPAVLNLVENRTPAAREAVGELLRGVSPAALGGEARGHVAGVTGPPGAGKSTLLSELVAAWRRGGRPRAGLPGGPPAEGPRGPPPAAPARVA